MIWFDIHWYDLLASEPSFVWSFPLKISNPHNLELIISLVQPSLRQICPGVHEIWSNIQTDKTENTTLYIYYLGNPALPRLLKVYAVYPHLRRFYRETKSENQAKNIPVGLQITVQGFLSYDRTNKQTPRQTNRSFILRFYTIYCTAIYTPITCSNVLKTSKYCTALSVLFTCFQTFIVLYCTICTVYLF